MAEAATASPAVCDELTRLGLLAPRRRDAGAVADALLEAFGDDRWHELSKPALAARLRSARPPAGVPGERRPRYAAIAAAGVVECTMAVGFDDARDAHPGSAAARVAALDDALERRGYAAGIEAAGALLGRRLTGAPCTTWRSRADAMTLAPPAGPRRTVPVVVKIVANVDGHCGDAAAAELAGGLRHAALSLYTGHWRYGLGPDFDAAPGIAVRDGNGSGHDPRDVARSARHESRARGEPIEATLDRWADEGRIALSRASAARVSFGDANLVPSSPAARLVHWAARRDAAAAPPAPTALAGGPRHRIWMLLSCRSTNSFPALRRDLPASQLRLVGVPGQMPLTAYEVLPWVLDAVCAGGGWREILGVGGRAGRPRDQQPVVDGWEDDPRVP